MPSPQDDEKVIRIFCCYKSFKFRALHKIVEVHAFLNFDSFFIINQIIDSVLWCICSVADAQLSPYVLNFCCYHIFVIIDIICDRLLNRNMVIWILYVKYMMFIPQVLIGYEVVNSQQGM